MLLRPTSSLRPLWNLIGCSTSSRSSRTRVAALHARSAAPDVAGMNVHLVGAGSAGCLLAYHLQYAVDELTKGTAGPIPITLQLRRPPPTSTSNATVTLYNNAEQEQGKRDFRWEIASASASRTSPIDVLFVATKADQTIDALKPLLPRLARTSDSGRSPATIVLTQNGVGLDEELVRVFGRSNDPAGLPNIVMGINRQGTWTKGRLETVHAAKGNFPFALSEHTKAHLNSYGLADAYRETKEDVKDSLAFTLRLLRSSYLEEALGFHVSQGATSDDFAIQQLQKLVSNCVINPLTALYNIRNGECGTRPDIRQIGEGIIEECAAVIAARRNGASVPQQLTSPALHAYVWDIVERLGANWSSMVQDMRSKRGATEIGYLNGTIARWAAEAGIAVPLNIEMVSRITAKAAREGEEAFCRR